MGINKFADIEKKTVFYSDSKKRAGNYDAEKESNTGIQNVGGIGVGW
jgi:hypothetical protein